jgi:hypothetical protein
MVDELTRRKPRSGETWGCAASIRAQVAAIAVKHGGRTWTVPIESACGAFIVGLEAPGPATLRVLDHDDRPLANADGSTARVA